MTRRCILFLICIPVLACFDVSTPQTSHHPPARKSHSPQAPEQKTGPRPDDTLAGGQNEDIENLRALGYVAGVVKAPEVTGVTRFVENSVFSGLNFYTSGHAPEAILMDMHGAVLHRWGREFEEMWPNQQLAKAKPQARFWRRAHLFENGDIIAIQAGRGLVKLDKRSNIIWAREGTFHHDLDVAPDGTIFVLTRKAQLVPHVDADKPALVDFITLLDPNGQELRSISLLKAMENSLPEVSWIRASNRFWSDERKHVIGGYRSDLFHTNSLEILDGSTEDKVPAFARGHLLVSMRHLEIVAVVDAKNEKVVWSMVGRFGMQHDPKITRDGMLMVFDNFWHPGKSRVVVFDPQTRDVEWQYTGSPDHPFYSSTRGAAQRLPNLNTVITESETGRAFEVTQKMEIVWEYLNPHRAIDAPEKIAVINELVRLRPDFPTAWIPTHKNQ